MDAFCTPITTISLTYVAQPSRDWILPNKVDIEEYSGYFLTLE